MNKKIYFISDIHLGSKQHKNSIDVEKKLCRWLDIVKKDASIIYLVGDIFDYWFEYKTVVPRGFTRFLGKISEITDSGIDVHFFIGNHDTWIKDYLSLECGIIVHKTPYIVEHNDKYFYIDHGDGLGDNSSSNIIMKKIFRSGILRFLFASIHPGITIPFAHSWSNYSRKKGYTSDFLGEDKEHLVLFAKEKIQQMPQINYFIFGHRHIILDYPIKKESNVVILGDWLTYFSYAEFDGKTLIMKKFDE